MTSKEVKVYLSKQITMCEEKIELYEKVKTSKDFIELHKNLLDFYKTIEKDLEILEITRTHKLLNYVIKNKKCAAMYHLTDEELNTLKGWLENEKL